MSARIASHQLLSIDRAIKHLCPIIEKRIKGHSRTNWTEFDLRRELVGCVLGSQVRHEMAVAATESLEEAGLFDDLWWTDEREDNFGLIAFDVLSGRMSELTHQSRYRFPKVRAQQLTRTRDLLARIPLSKRLELGTTPHDIRKRLIDEIPGLGPKQASMFLRNIGMTYELAILDVHVLRFLTIKELLTSEKTDIGTLKAYEYVERKISLYAKTIGYPAGYLDWAIWATMKAVREVWR